MIVDRKYAAFGGVTVTDTPTLIVQSNCWRKEIILTNNSDVIVYLGMDSTVTAETGTPCYENQTRGHTKDFGTWYGPIWGVCESEADVRWWETV